MKREDELTTRWIDGELDTAGRAELDKAMPEGAEAAKAEAEALRAALRAEFPAELEPPYAEFFNSQIQKRIREGEAEAVAPVPAARPASVWTWLRSPFTLGAAAAACLAIVAARNWGGGDGAKKPDPLVSAYAPDPTIKVVRAEYDAEVGATVILLSGLDRIPDEVEVGGRDIATYEPAGPRGMGRFFTGDAQLAYVLHTDADGAPHISPRG